MKKQLNSYLRYTINNSNSKPFLIYVYQSNYVCLINEFKFESNPKLFNTFDKYFYLNETQNYINFQFVTNS